MFIDSHCHLNHAKLADITPSGLISAANDAGVMGMLTICCRLSEEPKILNSIATAHDNVWYSVGTHPHDASNDAEKQFTTQNIIDLATAHDKIIAIGESGLDYYYDFADRGDQKQSFIKHIHACNETGLPLIVHAREADRDIIDIIRTHKSSTLTGVMHCFSSSPQMAREALDLGFYISFSGMITFKNANELRDIAAFVPINRMLIETDAPYLTPEPNRKFTNQPAFVVHTAAKLAQVHDKTTEEIGQITTDNFFNLFPKAKQTWQKA